MKEKTREKIAKTINWLEEKVKIGKYDVPKKYIAIIAGVFIFYVGINWINEAVSPMSDNKTVEKILKNKEENPQQEVPYESTGITAKGYQDSVNDFMKLSNEEIKKELKSQGIDITDAQIEQFKAQAAQNIPKTDAEARALVEKMDQATKEFEKLEKQQNAQQNVQQEQNNKK